MVGSMAPLRILHITHDLAIGGLQQMLVTLCRTADRQAFEFVVLCLRSLGPLAGELGTLGVPVVLLPQPVSPGTDYLSFLKVAKILKQYPVDVIHTHNTQPLLDGTLGSLLSLEKHRIIHTDHAREFPDKARYMFMEWLMSHFVHRVVGVSTHTTANLRAYEKIPDSKLLTIENGVDLERFSCGVDCIQKRSELGIAQDTPLIGVIARLEPVKGVEHLLRAMPTVLGRHPRLTLLIVGDGSIKGFLEQECNRLGISKHVVFTGARGDVPQLLKLLDVYVLPSESEGLPIGILEAMASGCPIVASHVGGVPDVLEHMTSALLVPPADPLRLAEAVSTLLSSGSLREKFARKAKCVVIQKFSSEVMTNKYCELYLGGR